MPQDILITPNKGSATTQGKIDFTGKGASASTITLKVLDDSSLSFEGTAGQLFSITPVLASGTIFSVNDVSGIPMIDVDASGLVRLAPLGGTVYSNTLYAVPRTVAGSGNSVTVRAADGLTSGAGGNILLLPGLQATTGGDGKIIVRQPGGTAGTNEVQMWHDGSQFHIKNFTAVADYGTSSSIILKSSNDFGVQIGRVGPSTVGVYPVGTSTIAIGNPSSQTVYAGWWYSNFYSGAWEPSNSTYPINWTDVGFYRGSVRQLVVGNYSSGGGSLCYTSSTPSALSTNPTNDLALSGSAFQRLSSSSALAVTGIAPPSGGAHVDGRVMWLHNVGSFNITLKHSQTSTAANQFINEGGGDIVLGPNRIVQCTYDSTSTKWRVNGEMYPYNFPTTDGTNGQVLTTNGSGTLSWATSSGGVSGSGTTNYVTKFTGTSAVGNSQIFDNGTNVGIGTASPSAKLHVVADSALTNPESDIGVYSLFLNSNATTNAGSAIGLGANGTAGAIIVGQRVGANNESVMKLQTRDSAGTAATRVTISSGGSVGIGTTSPGTILDIIGTGGSGVNSPGTALLRVSPSAQNTYAALELRTLNAGTYGGAGLMAVNDTNYDSNLLFYTNAAGSTTRTERMRITKNGDVGIGNTSPSATLHVTKATTAVATAIAAWPTYEPDTQTHARVTAFFTDGGNGGTATVATGTTTIIKFGEYYTGRVVLMPEGAGGQTPADQNSGAGRDIMLLGGKSDNTAGKTGGRVFIQGGSGFAGAYGSNFGNVILQANGGAVCIGGTSPVSTSPGLDITSDASSQLTGQLMIKRASTNDRFRLTCGVHTSNYAFVQAYENAIGGLVLALQPNSGTVGIGNTSPGAKLQIDTVAAATKGLIVKGAASQNANLQEWQNNSGTVLASIESTGRIVPTGALIYNQSPSVATLQVRSGNPSTTNIQEWQNFYGSVLSRVDADGNIIAPTASATIFYSEQWYGGSTYTFSRVFTLSGNLPSVVGNYIELFECTNSRSLPIRISINANDPHQGKVYDFVFGSTYAGGAGTGSIIPPLHSAGASSSNDFELEVYHVDSNLSRFRLRRTAGTSNRAFQAHINVQVGNTGVNFTRLSGTGTSTLGSTENPGYGINTHYISPIHASTYSGAGRSLTLAAANGQTSGAGGSIILQPGAQATTGGNGSIRFINPSNTAQYFYIAPSTSALDIGLVGISNDVNTGGINFNGTNIRGLGTVNTSALFAGSFYLSSTTLRSTFGASVQLGSSNGTSTDNINYIWMRQDGHIAWYGDIGLRRDGVGVLSVTNGSTGGGSLAYKSNTTNISAPTNDLVLNGSAFQRLNCTTACNLTGVAPPSGSHIDGRMMRIYNVGTANLTLKHNSTSSAVANRFCCVQAVDIILAPRDYAELIYDGTDGGLVGGQNNPCWRVH